MHAKIIDSLGDTVMVMTVEKISITGARTAILISIMYAFCTLLVSTVRRVISPAPEKRSMFSNEKSCTL